MSGTTAIPVFNSRHRDTQGSLTPRLKSILFCRSPGLRSGLDRAGLASSAFDLVYDRSCTLSQLLSDWRSGRSMSCCCLARFRTYLRMARPCKRGMDLFRDHWSPQAVPAKCGCALCNNYSAENLQKLMRI